MRLSILNKENVGNVVFYFLFLLIGMTTNIMASESFLPKRVGRVEALAGDVLIESAGKIKKKARTWSLINSSDVIRTEKNGRVKILFDSGDILILGPDSEITVKSYIYDPDKKQRMTVIDNFKGALKGIVRKFLNKSSSFRLKTTNADIGILGTEFDLFFERDKKLLKAFVKRGTISIKSNERNWEAILVSSGHYASLEGPLPPSKPVPFSDGKNKQIVKEPFSLDSIKFEKISKVLQRKWVRMLVNALPYKNAKDFDHGKDKLYEQLLLGVAPKSVAVESFEKSINNPQFIPMGEGDKLLLTVVTPQASIFYFIPFPKNGPVNLTALVKGGSQYFTLGNEATLFSKHSEILSKIDIGDIELQSPGIKKLGISIPKGGQLAAIEIKARGRSPITPLSGWKMKMKLTNYDMALNILQALTKGDLLPDKGMLPSIKKANKATESLGGLKGYIHHFEPFRIAKDGFYKIHSKDGRINEQKVIIDGNVDLEKDGDKTTKKAGYEATTYLSKGNHTVEIQSQDEKHPNSLFLVKKDVSFEQITAILEKLNFQFEGENNPVDEDLAQWNIDNLMRELRNTGIEVFDVPVKSESQKDIFIESHSLSPILPQEEGK